MTPIRLLALGTAVAAALSLAGCGAGPTSGAGTSPAAQAATTSAPAGQRFEIRVAGGQVRGGLQVLRVPLGTPVTLVVTSDGADEAHLHGYDKKAELAAGVPATIAFTADTPGVFQLELHKADLQLARLEVR